MPAAYPTPIEAQAWRFMAYSELVFRVLRRFARGACRTLLRAVCSTAYRRGFGCADANGAQGMPYAQRGYRGAFTWSVYHGVHHYHSRT
jgi:threonine synthase